MVTAGNCPSCAMESASLCVWKCVMALSGTGVCTRVEFALALPDPPPPEDPEVLVFPDPVREVPLNDVVALEEMPVEVLVLDKTVAFVVAVLDGDSAELEVALDDAADVAPALVEESADVEDTPEPTPLVEEAVNMALPVEGVTPDPAPEDDPAVFEAVALEVLLVEEDWM